MNKNINLLPKELRDNTTKDQVDLMKLLLVLIGVTVFAGYTLFFGWIKFAEYRAVRLERQLTAIMPEKVEAENLQKENKLMEQEIIELTNIMQEKKRWSPFLTDINNRLPQDMWITDISCDQEKNFYMQGLADNLSTVGLFLFELNELSYFQELRLVRSKEIRVGTSILVDYVLVGKLIGGNE
jgi:Tfp pilus assembly protein PilN